MPDEPFALSTMPSALPADTGYDALCAAVAATERGRWFLSEYARRNRSSDTAQVLAAIARIETAVTAERAQRADREADHNVHIELLEIARTIAQTRAEVAESQPQLSPAAARAPSDVATAAERLRQIAWTLRACGIDLPISEQIAQVAETILSAQALRGLSEQRAQKLAEALHYLEQRIDRMLDSRAAAAVPEAADHDANGHANGPTNGHANGPTNGHTNGHRHAAAPTPFTLADIDPETAPETDAAAIAAPSLQEPFAADADSAMMDAEESAAVKAAAEEAAAVVAAAEEAAEALAAEEEAAAVVAAAKEAAAVVAAAEEAAAAEVTSDAEITAPASEATGSAAIVAQEAASEPTVPETADDGPAQDIVAPSIVAEEVAAVAAEEVAVVAAEATAAPEASELTSEDSEAAPETPDEPPPAVGAELPKPIRLVPPSLDLDPPPVGRRPLAAQLGAAPVQFEAHEIQLERVEIEVVPLIAASAGGARAAPAIVQRITTEFVGLELSPPTVRPAVIVKPPAEPHTAEALSTKPAANQNLAARDVSTPELPAPSEGPSEALSEALKPADQATVDDRPVAVPPSLEQPPTVVDAVATPAEPTRIDEAPELHSRLPAATSADAIAMQVERDLNALTDIAVRADNPTDFLFLAPPSSAAGAPLAPPPKTTQLSNALAAIETELYAGAALASSTPPPPTATVKPTPPFVMTGPLAALMAMSEEEQIALFS